MKNTILTCILGMSLGAIAMGLGIIDLNTPFALALIIPGLLFAVPFFYINRNHSWFSWIWK